MIDATKVGKQIADLRKVKGLTQKPAGRAVERLLSSCFKMGAR